MIPCPSSNARVSLQRPDFLAQSIRIDAGAKSDHLASKTSRRLNSATSEGKVIICPNAGTQRAIPTRTVIMVVIVSEVCQLFCVNDQVLFLGMDARGKGQYPFPRSAT